MGDRVEVNLSSSLKKQADQWDWPLNRNDGIVEIINNDDRFEVVLEAAFFQPKEIEVKVIGDQLVVRCYHEEQTQQFGEVKREVNRCYNLPADVDKKSIKSNLTSRGHLVITAGKIHK
ncbi:Heat shock protein Hsp-12.2 [Toxocara canis]|uniref:Heat shock protein Hsp-12.2 n=2 Tax=Toxocara canis TaxID=6265 RepID=A0A0B2W2C0_TOXCA|nr:Heat shock protein Hsp-12.2 [Toxocara canis]VDM49375.1 unnamed protein product [Toxocara canis]